MNDRLKEIEGQSYIEFKDENSFDCLVFSKEKFAELIVRECAGLTLDYRNPDHYRGWLEYRDKIKKHFGVEE